MTRYITYAPYKDIPLFASHDQDKKIIDIPIGAELIEKNDILFYQNSYAICWTNSPNGLNHFSINNDGNGIIRGTIIQAIQQELKRKPDKVRILNAHERKLGKYKGTSLMFFWNWNNDFYKASIEELEYIAKLLQVKGLKEILKLYYEIKG